MLGHFIPLARIKDQGDNIMSWVIAAYYTRGTIYEGHANNLVQSLKTFSLPYEITPIDDLGSWYANMQFKPTLIKQMLEKYNQKSLIYVDVDAIFMAYPALFDDLDKMSNVDVAAHLLDHSKYRRRNAGTELLSGTLYFKNNECTSILIDRWIEECKKDPKLWDQVALARILGENYYKLPDRYCCIWDYMVGVQNPVIKHFQASRVARASERAKNK